MTVTEPDAAVVAVRGAAPTRFPKRRLKRQASLPKKFVGSFRADPIAAEFQDLADRWEDDTLITSSIQIMVDHDAYRRIIQMGPRVVPLIIRRMEQSQRYWFPALVRITGVNPAEGLTSVPEAIEAWRRWAVREGIVR